jgi:Ni,Fe-hydrogenase III small subunit
MGRNIALQAKKISAIELGKKDVIEDWKKKRAIFKRSFHIMMIDVGSCNACNIEVLNLSNPYYDLTRLGIFFTNSPKHADALVVVGALNTAMVGVLKRTYESMPNPKVVISVGACAISGGIFHDTEGFVSPIQDIIPVDVTVPGCPPTPIQILEGLLLTIGKLEKSSAATSLEDDNKTFQQG